MALLDNLQQPPKGFVDVQPPEGFTEVPLDVQSIKPPEGFVEIPAQDLSNVQPPAGFTEEPIQQPSGGGILPQPTGGILPQIKLGIKESVLPFSVTKEEESANQPATTAEQVARIGANIVSDVITGGAMTALAAATAGAATPITAVNYAAKVRKYAPYVIGAYRALGLESIQSAVEDRPWDVKNIAVNAVAEANPLLPGGALRKGAVQAAAGTEQARQYGAGAEGMLLAGALGGGIVGATTAVANHRKVAGVLTKIDDSAEDAMWLDKALAEKPKNSMDLEKVINDGLKTNKTRIEDMYNLLATTEEFTPKGGETRQIPVLRADFGEAVQDVPAGLRNNQQIRDYISTVREPTTAASELEATKALWTSEQMGFARWLANDAPLTGKELINKANMNLKARGLDLHDEWLRYQGYKAVTEAMADTSSRSLQALAHEVSLHDPMSSLVFRQFGDLMFTFRAIENRTGLPLDQTFTKIAGGFNEHGKFMTEVEAMLKTALKEAKTAGIDPKDMIDEVGKADTKLPAFRALLDKVYDKANEKGIRVDYKDLYVPGVTVDPAQFLQSVRKAAREIGPEAILTKSNQVSTEVNRALVNGEELNRVLSKALGAEVTTQDDIIAAFRALERPDILKEQIGFEAFAAYKAEDKFPEFLRQRDPRAMIARYANNVSKAAHLSTPIRELQAYSSVLHSTGMKDSAKYLDTYLGHISNRPPDEAANKLAQQTVLKSRLLDLLEDPSAPITDKAVARARMLSADFGSFLLNNVYSNLLGWKPNKVIRNLTQPMLFTGAEIGGRGFGYMSAMKSYIIATKELVTEGGIAGMEKKLGKFAPAAIANDVGQAFEDGFNSITAGRFARGVSSLNGIGMLPYSKTEIINRRVSQLMAEDVAKALINGTNKLTGLVEGMPIKTRQLAYKLVQAGDEAQLSNLMAGYLINKTQFVYGKHAMFQLGREHGKLVSMFAKFPSVVMSDVADMYRELSTVQASSKLAAKYIAPLAMVGLVLDSMFNDEKSPRERYIIGKHLVDVAPLAAAQVSTPMLLGAADQTAKAVKAAFNRDIEQAKKAGVQAVKPFVPVLPGIYDGLKEAIEAFDNRPRKGLID